MKTPAERGERKVHFCNFVGNSPAMLVQLHGQRRNELTIIRVFRNLITFDT